MSFLMHPHGQKRVKIFLFRMLSAIMVTTLLRLESAKNAENDHVLK